MQTEKMHTVRVEWVQEHIDTLESDAHFYALTRGDILHYVGFAYQRNVKENIQQTIRRLELDTKGLGLWLGRISDAGTTYGHLSEQIVEDVGHLIIFANKPAKNTQHKNSYHGRDAMQILCPGTELIKSFSFQSGEVEFL